MTRAPENGDGRKPFDDLRAVHVKQNPVTARLVERACDWRSSSARAHLAGRDDALVRVKPLLQHIDDWSAFLGERLTGEELEPIRARERTGRPLAALSFLKQIEKRLGRTLTKQKPGPKRRTPEPKRARTGDKYSVTLISSSRIVYNPIRTTHGLPTPPFTAITHSG